MSLKEQPKNVTELASTLDIERTRVSHALRELKKCHIIISKKEGRITIYSINENTPLEGEGSLFDLIEQHTKANWPS